MNGSQRASPPALATAAFAAGAVVTWVVLESAWPARAMPALTPPPAGSGNPAAAGEASHPGGAAPAGAGAAAAAGFLGQAAEGGGGPGPVAAAGFWRASEALGTRELDGALRRALATSPWNAWAAEAVEVLVERFFRSDPAALEELVETLEESERARLLPALARLDPSGAVRRFDALGEAGRSDLDLDAFVAALAGADAEAARSVAEALGPVARTRALGLVATRLARLDPDGALRFLRGLGDTDLAAALGDRGAISGLAAHDPLAVAALVDRLPAGRGTGEKSAALAREWGTQDPESALAWVRSIEFEAVRAESLSALMRSWVTGDRDRAFEVLAALPEPGVAAKRKLFGAMAGELIAHDLPGAAEWARTLSGEERAYALGALGSRLAQLDPGAAAGFLGEALETGEVRALKEATHDVGYGFALNDPVAASRWAGEFPAGDIHTKATSGVAWAWSESDPVAASEWIAGLPLGEARDHAIYALVYGIRDADPASAFNWASSVSDDAEKRLYLLKKATDSWALSEPGAAGEAIQRLALPEAERRVLLDRLEFHAIHPD